MPYKSLFTFFLLGLFSVSVFAQSGDARLQDELQSALQTQLKAKQIVNGPNLTEGSGILLLQDNSAANADTVEAMLVALSLPYVRSTSANFIASPVTTWLAYDCVIWVGTTSTGAELDSATAFLAAGGNLIVAENDEAYFFGGRTGPPSTLFGTYFQAQYVSDDGSDGMITGVDLMSGLTLDISADPFPDDVVLTGPNATGLFLAPGDTTFAALRASDGTYRAGLLLWDPQYGAHDTNTVIYSKIINFVAYNIVPVELTSFAANVSGQNVTLTWTTATETNNSGFNIERRYNYGNWKTVGFVSGHGTTTEPQAYSFIDSDLEAGRYSYRLKQVDFDGTSEYSQEVNVELTTPLTFELQQNYPNPFNPSTKIKYSVPSDGLVNIAVYNLLGEKVATLVNSYQQAGRYEVTFEANSLAGGIYFYSIEAGNFKSVKKMTLLK